MSFHIEPPGTPSRHRSKRIVMLGLFTAGALICGLLESRFPLPFPGMRIGLSNVFYILSLVLYAPVDAITLAAIRMMLLFTFTGNAFALACSASGLLLSLPLTIFLYRAFERSLSLKAISVASSCAFNIGQITAVVAITKEPRIYVYTPVLLAAGAVTGYAIGYAVEKVIERFGRGV